VQLGDRESGRGPNQAGGPRVQWSPTVCPIPGPNAEAALSVSRVQMVRVTMPVSQAAVGSARMRRVTVMGHRTPLPPGAPRVTFAHPAAPVGMASTVISQARLSPSPVVTIMALGQPEMPSRAMGFNVPGGITDTGSGSMTVPGGTVPACGGAHAGFAFYR
jgi:hypothetical protein